MGNANDNNPNPNNPTTPSQPPSTSRNDLLDYATDSNPPPASPQPIIKNDTAPVTLVESSDEIEKAKLLASESSEVKPSLGTKSPNDPQSPPNPQTVTILPKRPSKFFTIIVLGIILALIVWGVVIFLLLTGKKSSDQNSLLSFGQKGSSKLSPTPIFSPDQIKIQNGSVIRQMPNGEVKILVNKKEHPGSGIIGFAKVSVSPDNKKFCFESLPPAPEPALFYSEIDGASVVKVGNDYKNCIWLANEKFAYINNSPDTNPSDIYFYDTKLKLEKNITNPAATDSTLHYEIVGLSADSSKLICKSLNITEENATPVNCEVDINNELIIR